MNFSIIFLIFLLHLTVLITNCDAIREIEQKFDCINQKFKNIILKDRQQKVLTLSCAADQNLTKSDNDVFHPQECYVSEMHVDDGLCPNANTVYNFSQLDHLEFSNQPIQSFPKDFFGQFPNLYSLFLNNISLRNEDNLGFAYQHNRLERLQYFHLQDNHLKWISKTFLCRFPMLRELNLESNQLSTTGNSLTDCLDKLEFLNFQHNQLTTVNPGMISSNIMLSSINLAFNRIKHLPNGIFTGMPKLVSILLNDNQLETIDTDAFHSIIKLEILDLSNNLLVSIPKLNNLGNLALLSLSNNYIKNAKIESYSQFYHLETIWIESNKIEVVNFGDFCRFSQLRRLSLAKNPIKFIAEKAFECNENLRELILHETLLTSMNVMFIGPPLDHLDLSLCKIQEFFIRDIPLTLKNLNLSGNQIRSFATDIYENTAVISREFVLANMDMSNNQLTELDLQKLIPFSTLTNVDFSGNHISKLTRRKFDRWFMKDQGDPNEISINLRRNLISEICISGILVPPENEQANTKFIYFLEENPMIRCNCHMEFNNYFLQTNPTVISINNFDSLICRREYPKLGTFPQKIKDLDQIEDFMCRSRLLTEPSNCSQESFQFPSDFSDRYQCPFKCQCYLNGNGSYLVLDCSGHHLMIIPGLSELPPNVKILILYLDGNNFSRIYADSLKPYHHRLYHLYLNGSKLRALDSEAFHNMNRLELLNLNDNILTNLPSQLFEGMENLKELYLKGNKGLITLSRRILDPLQNLKVLTISDSMKLSTENLNTLKRINIFSKSGCDCKLYFMMSATLPKNSSKSSRIIECIGETAKRPEIFSLDKLKQQCTAKVNQNWQQSSTLWISIILIMIVFISFIFLIIMYRQEIQVLIFVKYGIRFQNCRNHGKNTRKSGKIFDAFISYSQLDEEFLVREFLPKLEKLRNPYRLCLHHRNFMPGTSINENIIMAVKQSSRVIILLSENFVKSEWCRYEFRVAHVQMLKDHRARVVIISLGPCLPDDLDQTMKLYTKTKTYLEWRDKNFWKKLKFWLPNVDRSRDNLNTFTSTIT